MKKPALIAFLLLTLFCCHSNKNTEKVGTRSNALDSISIEIIAINQGFGYEIYINDSKVIHQPHIPAIEGNLPFPNKELAFKTANLVVSKIQKNIIPPTLSMEEVTEVLAIQK